MDRVSIDEHTRRREYTGLFKETVLEQTRQPGASVSAVALSHGLNLMVHRWLREERQRVALERLQGTSVAFVPLQLPAVSLAAVLNDSILNGTQIATSEPAQDIRIEIGECYPPCCKARTFSTNSKNFARCSGNRL